MTLPYIRRIRLWRIVVCFALGTVICWICAHFSLRNIIMTDKKGLQAKNKFFYLDGKEMRILSGAFHYFRCLPEYWSHRLTTIRACGLNTVETYVPWNLHEETKGNYQFTKDMLNIRQFIQMAQKHDLYVILRPGPYICSEWDLGGLPSWLLNDPSMKVRSTYQPYLDAVDQYFSKLIPLVADLQYSKGGPIIAVQVENEYGSYGSDRKHMKAIMESLKKHGITELMFTSDNEQGIKTGAIPGVLMTGNFDNVQHGKEIYGHIKEVNSDWPLMTMEFWSGWFDHWGEKHHQTDIPKFEQTLSFIVELGSVNIYMFFGGTNFGFMNGANDNPYTATITSYDYDAPLSESGHPTDKYYRTKAILQRIVPQYISNNLPKLPDPIPSKSYGQVQMEAYITLEDMLSFEGAIASNDVMAMEMLPINNGGGQGYGYTLYRTLITKGGQEKVIIQFQDHIRDRAVVLLDGKQVGILDWKAADQEMHLKMDKDSQTLDILVENLGRVNYANSGSNILNEQRKGLLSPILLDGKRLEGWQIYPLEFKKANLEKARLSNKWKKYAKVDNVPVLYKATVDIQNDTPADTYINTQGWTKGTVFVNSFNLGRYWNIGPQQTLYIPGPLLQKGTNELMIFELHSTTGSITLQEKPNLG